MVQLLLDSFEGDISANLEVNRSALDVNSQWYI